MRKKLLAFCLSFALALCSVSAGAEELLVEELSEAELLDVGSSEPSGEEGPEDLIVEEQELPVEEVPQEAGGSDGAADVALAEPAAEADGAEEIAQEEAAAEPADGGLSIEIEEVTPEEAAELGISTGSEEPVYGGEEAIEAVVEGGTLEESGLASTAWKAVARSGVARYTGSYGAQLSGNTKAVYDAFVANYVTSRGSGQVSCELEEYLEPFAVYPTTKEDGSTDWNLSTNETYQGSILPQMRSILQPAYDAFLYDYPEVFWMAAPSYGAGFTCTSDGDGNWICTVKKLAVTPKERYSGAASEIAAFDQAVEAAAWEISASLSAEASQYDRAAAVHDWVCGHASYEENDYAHTAAGVFLKDGKVVCEGYAKAFKILCGKLGVTAALVPGLVNSSGEGHMWNHVQMEDGNWYLVDATWDDRSSGTVKTYFLAGSTSAGFSGSVLAEERTFYDNFSASDYTQRFGLPGLASQQYQEGDTEHEHSQVLLESTVTCTEDGYELYGCSDCAWTMKVSVDSLGHDYGEYSPNSDATCVEDGTKTAECSRCGAKDTVTDAGSALGHDYGEYSPNNDATCVEDGTKTAECSRCGAKDTVADAGSALGHDYGEYSPNSDATCVEDGTKTAECSRCGAKDTVTDAGSALGHDYAYVSNKDATCTMDGTKTQVCTREGCGAVGETVTDVGSALGHDYAEDPARGIAVCSHGCGSTVPLTEYLSCGILEEMNLESEGGLAGESSSAGETVTGPAAAAYSGSYGAQLSGNAKAVYNAFVASYVSNRGNGQMACTLTETLDPFAVYPTTNEDGSINWNLGTNETYQNVILPQVKAVVQPAYDAFVYDYPEVFWMAAPAYGSGVTYSQDGAGNWSCTVKSVVVSPKERYSGASTEIAAFDQAVAAAVSEISASLSAGASRYDQVKAIHGWICSHASYMEGAYARSAAGIFLKDGAVVCEGYAKAMRILCRSFGIDAVLIPGNVRKADGSYEGHMWNHVQMEDGNWYLVDATWDDRASGLADTYLLAGSGSVGFYTYTIAEERIIFDNFSSSDYTQRFAVPRLSSGKYQTGNTEHAHSRILLGNTASCTEDGYELYGCSEPGCAWTEKVLARSLGHDYAYVSDDNATCKADGTKTAVCTRCGARADTVTDAGSALGHSYGDYVSNGDATCTADGTKTAVCGRCGAVVTAVDAGSALGHSYGAYASNGDATCTADGTKTAVCTRCGGKNTVADTGSALGHSYGKYTSNKDATALKDGTKTAVCSRCGGKNTVTDTGSKLKATMTLSVSSLTLKTGQSTTALTVSGLAKGDSVKACTSANTAKVKVVLKSGKITVTAQKKTGSTSITVKLASGATKKVPVKVQSTTVKTTKISGLSSKVTLAKGKKATLKPVLTPVTSQEKVTYSTSDKKVATVSSKGVITAKGAGTAKVTVKSGSKKAVVTVTVKKTATTKLTGVPTKLSLAKGKTYTLKAKRTPAGSDYPITYSSSDKKVVTVSSKGVITAKGAGTAKVTVKSGSKKAVVTVTVKKTATTKLTGVPTKLSLAKGKTYTLKAKRTPAGSDYPITYSSSNKKVATVSSGGKVKAVKKGTATITVKSGTVSVKCKVTVK